MFCASLTSLLAVAHTPRTSGRPPPNVEDPMPWLFPYRITFLSCGLLLFSLALRSRHARQVKPFPSRQTQKKICRLRGGGNNIFFPAAQPEPIGIVGLVCSIHPKRQIWPNIGCSSLGRTVPSRRARILLHPMTVPPSRS